MPFEQHLFVTKEPVMLSFGDFAMRAESYRLAMKRPELRTTLIDGACSETVLGLLPCELSACGIFLSEDAFDLRETLREAIENLTPFSFTFDGMTFANMTLRDYTLDKSAQERCFQVKVRLCGSLTGEVEPN